MNTRDGLKTIKNYRVESGFEDKLFRKTYLPEHSSEDWGVFTKRFFTKGFFTKRKRRKAFLLYNGATMRIADYLRSQLLFLDYYFNYCFSSLLFLKLYGLRYLCFYVSILSSYRFYLSFSSRDRFFVRNL